MLESVARAEDIVKVYEARLTEKETTSLSPSEVEDYMLTLKVYSLPKITAAFSGVGAHQYVLLFAKYPENACFLGVLNV